MAKAILEPATLQLAAPGKQCSGLLGNEGDSTLPQEWKLQAPARTTPSRPDLRRRSSWHSALSYQRGGAPQAVNATPLVIVVEGRLAPTLRAALFFFDFARAVRLDKAALTAVRL